MEVSKKEKTDKLCSRCGLLLATSTFNKGKKYRDGFQCWCKACQRDERAENKERYQKRHAEYYQRNKPRFAAAAKEWAVRHPEQRKAIYTRSYWKDVDGTRQCKRVSWKRNYDKNRPSIIERARERRARKRGAPGHVTPGEWRHKLATYGGRCAYCGSSDDIGQDHMIPLIRDGAHVITNLIPACRSCNAQKKEKTIAEFLYRRWRNAAYTVTNTDVGIRVFAGR